MKFYEKAALAAFNLDNIGPIEEGGGWWGKGVDDCIAALRAAATASAWYKPWTWLKYVFLTAATLLEFIKQQKLAQKKALETEGA